MLKNLTRLRQVPRIIFKRYSSKKLKPDHTDLESYLKYAEKTEHNTASTVFHGTIFELQAKKKLQELLNIEELAHSGGTFDNGIDIIGKLDASDWKNGLDVEDSYSLKNKKIKPLITRKKAVADILIQCKNYQAKISAKEIRELSGTYNYHVKRAQKYTTLVIMVAPQVATAQAISQINKVEMPLIFCQMSRLEPIGANKYDPSHYKGGEILGFYFNPIASLLFRGTDFQSKLMSNVRTI